MSNDIRYGAPCSMCGGASGHPADGSGCDRPAPHFGTTDILATGPTRPGYQHSPATYVEGREAPRLLRPVESMPCAIHGDVMMGCWVCARDALEGATDAATVEACARAAYDGYHGGMPRYRWDAPEGDYSVRPEVKEAFRAAAKAVLAAAGRGGK